MRKKFERNSSGRIPGLKVLCGTVLTLALSVNLAQAAYQNPYTTTPTIQLSQTEKTAYMDQKTKALFSSKTAPKQEAYVAPKGWQQDLDGWKAMKLEKYTADHKKNDKVILQLHGGGYVLGNSDRHRDWAIARAEAIGSGEVYMLNYRYYPEAKYPAALEDAAAAYQELLRSGIPAKNIVVMGDSAGGNLALALGLYLRDHKVEEPSALVLYSPWGDAGTLPSHVLNQEKDVILGERNQFMDAAVMENKSYFQDANLKDPYVSPVYGDFHGIPPMLIIAGNDELFVDDCLLLERRAKEAGVKVETHLFPGMSHDWVMIFPELSESKDTYPILTKFVKALK